MFEKQWNDCYVSWDNGMLCVGNAVMERRFRLWDGMLLTILVRSHETGYCWEGSEPEKMVSVGEDVFCQAGPEDDEGLSAPYLAVSLSCTDSRSRHVIHQIRIYPGLPFVQMSRKIKGTPRVIQQEAGKGFDGVENLYATRSECENLPPLDDVCDAIPLPRAHLKIERIMLFDKTDGCDTVIKRDVQPIYRRQRYCGVGNIFIVTDYEKNEALIVVKKAPTFESAVQHTGADMCVNDDVLWITSAGFDSSVGVDEYTQLYGTVVGVGSADRIENLYKDFERAYDLGDSFRHTYTMSNTWGDRNQDGSLSHEFIIQEIDVARKLGVDIVQIDDGWQQGMSANSVLGNGAWADYYSEDEDFWKVNKKRFPQGLQPIVDYAAQFDIEISLWFAPDSANDFAAWERDAQTLLSLYYDYGIRHIKLDSVNFTTKLGEQNFQRMLRRVYRESGNRICFNLDITAQNRLGYLMGKEFGVLYLENRYTDWGNYYPHKTLKNLWALSRFFPTRQFQMELLNNRRHPEMYEGDQMAPVLYGIDYEFACTMLANPLVFMEMSFLASEDVEKLAGIMEVYRAHREALWNAQITPIGNEPDGLQFSGFEAVCPDGTIYLLLFRENALQDVYTYQLSASVQEKELEVLCTDATQADYNLRNTADGLTWYCTRPRTYLFAVYR